jgi:hypothetical protein
MSGRYLWLVGALLLAAAVALPARAQTPEDLVRWIYTSLTLPGPAEAKGLAFLSAPAQRRQFLSRRLADFHDANDSYGTDLMTACVDFGFAIPGQDFDEAEIARTLSVTSTGDPARPTVTARFTNFGQPAAIAYDFIPEDGALRIDDIAGPGWRVSLIPCAPKGGPVAAPAVTASTGYCYRVDETILRLDVAGDGQAVFALESWQANGHSCGAAGAARPIEGGWVHETGACRIEILVTPESGLRLTDRDWICKETMCGARAVIDGLAFPRASQVDCALMPAN